MYIFTRYPPPLTIHWPPTGSKLPHFACFKKIIFQWHVHIHISVNKQWSSPSNIFAASVGHKAWIIHWEEFATFVSYNIALSFLFLRWPVYTCGIHRLCCHNFSLRLKKLPNASLWVFIVASFNLIWNMFHCP